MKQGIFFVGGLIIAGGSLYFDYRKLYRFVPILYGINAILLLVVKFAGTSALGARAGSRSALSRCSLPNLQKSS